ALRMHISIYLFRHSPYTLILLFFLIPLLPPRPTLFPYTTLFRSGWKNATHSQVRSTDGQPLSRIMGNHSRRQCVLRREWFPIILDRKSTRLNSSHGSISYAVFCLKKKKR